MKKYSKFLLVAFFLYLSIGTSAVLGFNETDQTIINEHEITIVPIQETVTDPNIDRDPAGGAPAPGVNQVPGTDPAPGINEAPGTVREGPIGTPDVNVPGGPADNRNYTTTGETPGPGVNNPVVADEPNNVPTIVISSVIGLIVGSLLTYSFVFPRREGV